MLPAAKQGKPVAHERLRQKRPAFDRQHGSGDFDVSIGQGALQLVGAVLRDMERNTSVLPLARGRV
jgi:hypothetical protein